jgi:hypothetical protein
MKVKEKIAKVDRLLIKLQNQNRCNLTYKDDLDHAFIECWSIKEWIKNDSELKIRIPQVGKITEQVANSNTSIMIVSDVANREKHLFLRDPKETNAAIKNSHLGIHVSETISLSLTAHISVIHVDDLEEYDKNKANEPSKTTQPSTQQSSCEITQTYVIEDKDGRSYDALEVLKEAIGLWREFINQLDGEPNES